jgi:hypothetical protein
MGARGCWLGFAVLGAWAAGGGRAHAEDRAVEPVRQWAGLLDDKKLTDLAPAKGYVTSEAGWRKVWEAWRPGDELPAVDFSKHLVLVGLGGMYPVGHDLRVTDGGDLTVRLSPRVPGKPGFGYGLAVVERAGVKTIRGKAIEPD